MHENLIEKVKKIKSLPVYFNIKNNEKFILNKKKMFDILDQRIDLYLEQPSDQSFEDFRDSYNELLVVYQLLEKWSDLKFISYEVAPALVDFQVEFQDNILFQVEVKSIYPNFYAKDVNKEKYKLALSRKAFPPNHSVVFSDSHGGEEIMHHRLSARTHMIEYIYDFEKKLSRSEDVFSSTILVFVGNGVGWNRTVLEDVVFFYRTGKPHSSDSFHDPGSKILLENGSFKKTIQKFYFLKIPDLFNDTVEYLQEITEPHEFFK